MDEPIPGTPYDASDPKQVEKQSRASARRQKAMRSVVIGLLSNADGRAWVWGYLEFCQVLGNPFVPGQPDATAFLLGQANVGKRLLAEVMAAAPEQYMIMAKENS